MQGVSISQDIRALKWYIVGFIAVYVKILLKTSSDSKKFDTLTMYSHKCTL